MEETNTKPTPTNDKTAANNDQKFKKKNKGYMRPWTTEPRSNNTTTGSDEAQEEKDPRMEGKKKRKVGLLLAYLGTKYQGLQFVPSGKAVENYLENAIFQAGGISKRNHEDINKIKWSRGSRTDKGVHALKNVVSFKMMVNVEDMEKDTLGKHVTEEINKYLPEDIRAIACVKTYSTFRARSWCETRTYEYLMPYSVIQQGKYSLEELRDILKMFYGHHYFHNFFTGNTPKPKPQTKQKPKVSNNEEPDEDSENEEEKDIDDIEVVPKEPKYLTSRSEQLANWKLYQVPILQRTVHMFTVTDPFTAKTAQGKEQTWVKFIIKGNSFLTHQIRKMISLTIAIITGVIQKELLLPILDSPMRFAIPLAPANFLYLKDNTWLGHDKKPYKLFPDSTELTSDIENFANNVLYPHLIELHETKDQFQEIVEMWPRFKVEDYEEVMRIYNDWRKMVDEKKQQAKLRRAAATAQKETGAEGQPNKKQKLQEDTASAVPVQSEL